MYEIRRSRAADAEALGTLYRRSVESLGPRCDAPDQVRAWAAETAAGMRGITRLTTHASAVARGFFRRMGFAETARRDFAVGGVAMHNYALERVLRPTDRRDEMDAPSFAARPLRTAPQVVLPAWIDYNGHMNVAYYTLAFDRALDEVYDILGMGPGLVAEHNMGPMALQTQIHYLGELLDGERFACDVIMHDADAKRAHVICSMIKLSDGSVAATYESLTLNVDLAARRSAPFPPGPAARVEALRAAHAGLSRPTQLGAPLGIRRKG